MVNAMILDAAATAVGQCAASPAGGRSQGVPGAAGAFPPMLENALANASASSAVRRLFSAASGESRQDLSQAAQAVALENLAAVGMTAGIAQQGGLDGDFPEHDVDAQAAAMAMLMAALAPLTPAVDIQSQAVIAITREAPVPEGINQGAPAPAAEGAAGQPVPASADASTVADGQFARVSEAPAQSAAVQADDMPDARLASQVRGGGTVEVAANAVSPPAPPPAAVPVKAGPDNMLQPQEAAPSAQVHVEAATADTARPARSDEAAQSKPAPAQTIPDAAPRVQAQADNVGLTAAEAGKDAGLAVAQGMAVRAELAADDVETPVGGQGEQGGRALDALHAARPQAAAAPGGAEVESAGTGADQERLIARVAQALAQADHAGRSTIRIRLYPPELGTLRIEVTGTRAGVSARIDTSTPEAQGALHSNLAALRAQLRDAGVDMRNIDVQYRGASSQFGASHEEARRGGYQAPRHYSKGRFDDPADPVEPVARVAREGAAGVLNVLV